MNAKFAKKRRGKERGEIQKEGVVRVAWLGPAEVTEQGIDGGIEMLFRTIVTEVIAAASGERWPKPLPKKQPPGCAPGGCERNS